MALGHSMSFMCQYRCALHGMSCPSVVMCVDSDIITHSWSHCIPQQLTPNPITPCVYLFSSEIPCSIASTLDPRTSFARSSHVDLFSATWHPISPLPSYPPMTVPPTHANSCRHDRRNSRFCLQLRDSSTHGLRQHTDIRDPQAALVCAATHCLASPLFNTISPPHRHAIPTLLCDTDAPRSTVFHALSYGPVAHFRVLASALRAHALGTLECAL